MQVDTVHSVVTVSLLTTKTEPVLVGLWYNITTSVPSRPERKHLSVKSLLFVRRQNSGRNIGEMCTAAKLEKGSEVTAQVLIL